MSPFVLGAALAVAAGAAPPVSVALDLSPLDTGTYRRIGGLALEKQAVLRLVQESFAVVAPSATPEVVVRIQAAPAGLRLDAWSRTAVQGRDVAIAPAEALQELHLEVSQKIVELARAVSPVRATLSGSEAPYEPDGSTEPFPVAVKPRSTSIGPLAPRWWAFDVAAAAELAFRKGGNDGQGRLALRWGGRLGIRLTGALAPSQAGELTALDWTVLGGPSWRQPLGDRFDLEVDLLGGGAAPPLHLPVGSRERSSG